MPILLILAVAAACLPLPWPDPPAGVGPLGSLVLPAAVTLAPVLAAGILSAWAVRALHHSPDRRPAVLATYSHVRRLLGLANLAAAAVAVVGLGWGWTVWQGGWFALGSQPVPGADLIAFHAPPCASRSAAWIRWASSSSWLAGAPIPTWRCR